MKYSKYLLALTMFLIPIIATSLWFYSSLPKTQHAALPDFPAIDLPIPPLSTPLPAVSQTNSVNTSVLIDMKHGNQVSLSEIDPIIRNLETIGAAILVYRDDGDLETSLKSVNSLVIVAPLTIYSNEDLRVLTNFVARGGRLVVITDPTRNTLFADNGVAGISGVDTANILLEPFDLAFNDDYLYNMVENEGNFRNIILKEFAADSLMKDVNQLVLYGSHSLNPQGRHLSTVSAETRSSTNDMATALSPMNLTNFGEGQVLAVGDVSFLTSQYIQSADNQIFARNLARFLTSSNREKTLADFPALFDNKVTVQPVGNVKVTGELVSSIANLEKILSEKPGDLSISLTPSKNEDRIILSTFEPDKVTEKLLIDLGINLSPQPTQPEMGTTPTEEINITLLEITPTVVVETDTPRGLDIPPFGLNTSPTLTESISLPGTGVIEINGLGVIGLEKVNQSTTLIIMASSQEKIIELINLISSENLKNCLIYENVGACRISEYSIQPVG